MSPKCIFRPVFSETVAHGGCCRERARKDMLQVLHQGISASTCSKYRVSALRRNLSEFLLKQVLKPRDLDHIHSQRQDFWHKKHHIQGLISFTEEVLPAHTRLASNKGPSPLNISGRVLRDILHTLKNRSPFIHSKKQQLCAWHNTNLCHASGMEFLHCPHP